MRVAIHTLGCKQNAAESSHIRQQYEDLGYQLVELYEPTDLLILNTCTVTENADTECRKIIRRALRSAPDALVAVTGCYAQLKPEELASVEGVSLVAGTSHKFRLPELTEQLNKDQPTLVVVEELEDAEFVEAMVSDNDSHTRAFLKIQDGCDYTCTFCTIPQARGPSRSMALDHIEQRIMDLSNSGFREAVLTGINLGEYRDDEGHDLEDVLRTIDGLDLALRVRVTSIEVNKLKQSMISLIAQSDVLCHHFHLPLQSGSDEILARMRRRYTSSMYNDVLLSIREQMPDACIGADLICGFPGETDEHFEQSLKFIEQSSINYLHVFSYSERDNTKAAEHTEQVPVHIRRERTRRMRLLGEQKRRDFYRSQRGRRAWVVSEGFNPLSGLSNGWTNNYVRVQYPGSSRVQQDACMVELGDQRGDYVQGSPCDVAHDLNPMLSKAYIPLIVNQSV